MKTKRISKAVAATVAVVGIAAPAAQAHYSTSDQDSVVYGSVQTNAPRYGSPSRFDYPGAGVAAVSSTTTSSGRDWSTISAEAGGGAAVLVAIGGVLVLMRRQGQRPSRAGLAGA